MKWHLPENTTYNMRNVAPAITVNSDGQIRLNCAAIDLLKLKDKDGVAFGQDETELKDWFIRKDSKGFTVRFRLTDGSTSCFANSKQLAFNILDSLGHSLVKYVTFRLSLSETINGYAIITAKPVKVKPL